MLTNNNIASSHAIQTLQKTMRNQGEIIQRMNKVNMTSPLSKRTKYTVDDSPATPGLKWSHEANPPPVILSARLSVSEEPMPTRPQDAPGYLVRVGASTKTSMTSSVNGGSAFKVLEMPAVNLMDKLSGLQQNKETTQGITVKIELEQPWNIGTLTTKNIKQQAGVTLDEMCLFDTKNTYFIRYNDHFLGGNEYRCRDGMRLVAITMTNCHWNTSTGDALE
jgi:hypothetical protein